MLCKKGGNEIPDGSIFCTMCGAKILNEETNNFKKDIEQEVVQVHKQLMSKKRKIISAIIVIVLMSFIVVGAISIYIKNNKTRSNNTTINANSPKIDSTINVTMDVKHETSNYGTTKFDITTNLPNDTELMITLSNNAISYKAQDKTTVYDGKVQTSGFSNNSIPLSNGNYTIEITTPTASVQPNSVKSLFGDMGKNLSGSYIVDDATWGKTVDFKKDITISNNTTITSTNNSNTSGKVTEEEATKLIQNKYGSKFYIYKDATYGDVHLPQDKYYFFICDNFGDDAMPCVNKFTGKTYLMGSDGQFHLQH